MARSRVSEMEPSRDDQYTFAPFTLDPIARTLRRDGEIVPIGAKTFDLLVFLVERRGQVLTKDARPLRMPTAPAMRPSPSRCRTTAAPRPAASTPTKARRR